MTASVRQASITTSLRAMKRPVVPPSAATADEALLDRLRAGDPDGFEALVRRHGGYMLRVARRLLRDEEDARDCVQDAFLRALQGIERFEGRAALGTWLHRIVVNGALSKLRERERRREVSLEDLMADLERPTEGSEGPQAPPDAILEARQDHEMIRACLQRLPRSYRDVLLARDIGGFGTAETAALLRLTPTNVKVRLHRARSALRRLLAAELAVSRA